VWLVRLLGTVTGRRREDDLRDEIQQHLEPLARGAPWPRLVRRRGTLLVGTGLFVASLWKALHVDSDSGPSKRTRTTTPQEC
jgi:hypothetical protein